MSDLTPWKDSLLEDLAEALRGIVGLAAQVPMVCVDEAADRNPSLRLRIDIDSQTNQWSLRLTDPDGGPALWKNAQLAVSHGPLGDPGLARVVRALPARLTAMAATPQWSVMLGALWAWRRSRAVPESEWALLDRHELVLRLLFACNQNCSFCWQDRRWPAAPDAVLHRWVDEAHQLGRRRLTLSGGEPTLHPRLADFVAHGARLGMEVGLQSNAITLGAQPALLQRLVGAGLRSVVVSWHSPRAEVSDVMTRAPGTHRQTAEGVGACLRAGLGVTLNCVVDQRNYRGLLEHAQDVSRRFGGLAHGDGWLAVSYSHPNAPYERQRAAELLVPLDEVAGPLASAMRHLHDQGIVAQASGDCGFPICAQRDVIGLVPPLALHANSPTGRAGRALQPACQGCKVARLCVGPRTTYVQQLGQRGLVAFPAVPAGLGAQLPQRLVDWWRSQG